MTWDEEQQQDLNVSQGYCAPWTLAYIPARLWHLSEEKVWGARSGRFAQRVIFMAFWTEIWKLQVPLWHFFLKHMITPDKDLEAKFWGWEVVCPLWVGRNFSDGGKWGHRSGTGSWYFGDTPLLFLPGSFFHSLPNHSDPESTQEGMSHLVSAWGSLLKESRFLGTFQSWGYMHQQTPRSSECQDR